MERELKEIKKYRIENFDYYKLMIDHSVDGNSNDILEHMEIYYKEYLRIRKKNFSELEIKSYPMDILELKSKMYENLSSNESELCNAAIYLTYDKNKKYKKDFVWEVFGDKIVENVIENTGGVIHIPVQDENGDITYLYNKYKIIDIDLNDAE